MFRGMIKYQRPTTLRSFSARPPCRCFRPASWFRLKYPHIVHGAIAASAPVLALEGLRHPTPDPEAFARRVTNAAGQAGGAAESCANNVRHAFAAVLDSSAALTGDDSTGVGRRDAKLRGASFNADGFAADAARRLRVCPGHEPKGDGALEALAWWARAAFDYLAMGNFPYATGYILNSDDDGVELPPWPLRKACSYLADPSLQVRRYGRVCAEEHHYGDGEVLLLFMIPYPPTALNIV